MATQEGQAVSYIVEQSRDISTYNKLMKATQKYLFDEELNQRIQNLPDDMIRVIKEYVINPYKFMEEFKLYKPIKYIYGYSDLYEEFYLKSEDKLIRHYEVNQTVNLLKQLKRNTVDYEDLQIILRNLQIKGRTKLIKYKTYIDENNINESIHDLEVVTRRQKAIIQAILKQE